MTKNHKEETKLAKELVKTIIGGALVGFFSLFFLPIEAIEYWWLIWIISAFAILLWRLLKIKFFSNK